ncbi:MAG: glycosyltransferase family 2 protein [Wenzhouxiangellaceae bacterium]
MMRFERGGTATALRERSDRRPVIPGASAGRRGRQSTIKIERLSVVVPVYNEADNIPALVQEIEQAAPRLADDYEIIIVDDGSTDATPERLAELARTCRQLRIARLAQNRGQSAALAHGIELAGFDWVGTLDGDGQNIPADFAHLIRAVEQHERPAQVGLVMGHRQQRNDPWIKRISSKIANATRMRLLGDGVPDTGCGIKLIRRELFMVLPRFNHMHRFLPVLCQMHDFEVLSVPVGHRPRQSGRSKYGTLDRLAAGLLDLFGVWWLKRRHIPIRKPGKETDRQ